MSLREIEQLTEQHVPDIVTEKIKVQGLRYRRVLSLRQLRFS